MSPLRKFLAALVCGAVGLVAVGLPAGVFAQENTAGQSAAQAPADAAAPAPAAEGVAPNYIIGPGDTIQIFVWRNPELSTTVPVRPDGKVSTPLVEDLVAVGKTPSELARDIEARLSEYIRSPQVNIIVTNPMSRFSEIKVIGQVGTPGAVPYRDGMTLLDVILEVGGLTEFAAGNRARLVRKDENGKTQEIKVKLESLVKKGKLKENMEVQPGDMIVVPESYF
jgi:polysaccharide biosynthesis/export protein